jgi:hypothetical protein
MLMAQAKSTVGGDDGICFQEVEKGPRRRRERPPSVMDDVETPREVETLDADRSQVPRVQLPLVAEPCGFRSEVAAEADADVARRVVADRRAAELTMSLAGLSTRSRPGQQMTLGQSNRAPVRLSPGLSADRRRRPSLRLPTVASSRATSESSGKRSDLVSLLLSDSIRVSADPFEPPYRKSRSRTCRIFHLDLTGRLVQSSDVFARSMLRCRRTDTRKKTPKREVGGERCPVAPRLP